MFGKLSLLSARYPVFPGPPRGHAKINSDAHALAQLEALLGRETLERAARSCHKQILESPVLLVPIKRVNISMIKQHN